MLVLKLLKEDKCQPSNHFNLLARWVIWYEVVVSDVFILF